MKITIIGAGSIVFTKTILLDILSSKLKGIEFCLMDPNEEKLISVKRFADKVIRDNNCFASVSITTSQREAVEKADYIITTFQIGGLKATTLDYEIPMKYGVDQCIGDTLSPGGVFRALRSIPVTMNLAKDIEELSPKALLLNYVNPMSMVCLALGRTKVNFVGLCHGVQVTLDLIAGYCGVPKKEITFVNAGINHMSWFLKLEHKGKDLYPILRDRFEKPEYYVNDKVRGEVFRHFGYFMTESTGHLSEYLPYFRKNKKALDLYCDEPAFGGESGAHVKWSQLVSKKLAESDILKDESTTIPPRSIEYGSYIIEAKEIDVPFHFHGNVMNDGMITNLPNDCCVEIPVFSDGKGINKVKVGDLPTQCAALNLTNINVHKLTVESALSGDPEGIMMALALDPLTSAVLTLKEIREMATEMLDSQRSWLPQFEGKRIEPKPTITIAKNIKRAEVPVDPALAVAHRFGELAEKGN